MTPTNDSTRSRPLTDAERERLQHDARDLRQALEAFEARYGPGVIPPGLGQATAGPFAKAKLQAVVALLRDDLAHARCVAAKQPTTRLRRFRAMVERLIKRKRRKPPMTDETNVSSNQTVSDLPTEFFDRYGNSIGRIQWVIDRHDPPYWLIGRDADEERGWEVETVWVGFDPLRRSPPMIFRSVVFHWGRRILVEEYPDSGAALDGHDNLVHCKLNNLPLDE